MFIIKRRELNWNLWPTFNSKKQKKTIDFLSLKLLSLSLAMGNRLPCINIDGVNEMLNFEEELKKFKPSLEVEEIEDSISQGNTIDAVELISQIINKQD